MLQGSTLIILKYLNIRSIAWSTSSTPLCSFQNSTQHETSVRWLDHSFLKCSQTWDTCLIWHHEMEPSKPVWAHSLSAIRNAPKKQPPPRHPAAAFWAPPVFQDYEWIREIFTKTSSRQTQRGNLKPALGTWVQRQVRRLGCLTENENCSLRMKLLLDSHPHAWLNSLAVAQNEEAR